jgi:thiamine-monophosphate kinase
MDERELIRRIGGIIGPEHVADDCAVLRQGDHLLVVSTDMLHEKTDFPAGMTDRQAGWMAAAVTLSDIAAMGAKPVALLLAAGLDRAERLEEIIRGADECCRRSGAALVGGDVDAHEELTLVSTGIGTARPSDCVRRSGADPGDLVCITGTPGRAQAGLLGYALHRKALFEPQPMVREGQLLALAGATSMMDVSDGIALSLFDMLGVNDCGFAVESNKIPLPEEVEAGTALECALYGGGDFGLLFTIPPERYPVSGVACTAIGIVVSEHSVLLDGSEMERRGYQHRWE